MFESIRKHSKIVMLLLFLLIIPSFVLVGINRNYFSEASPVVARVDGKNILQSDWDNAHRMETDRIRAQSPSVDVKLLDSPQARYSTLERLVRDRVFQAAVQDMHLVTSDSRLARSLQEIPAIASLKRPEGTLDAQAYRELVASQGLTPEGFESNMRHELSANQVMGGIVATALATDTQVKLGLDALYQRREIQVARFMPTEFAAKINPSDAELEAYYKAHPTLFQQSEHAAVEYVVLDIDSVRAGITPNEDDLRIYYKENLERLAGKEERRASHILVNAPKDAAPADREKAKNRATELLEQIRKTPTNFAEIAKKSSDDKGSSTTGGDLGFFARGAMVKPFEDTAFSLKKGDISDLVETDFGYHIIQLNDIKTPHQPSFEELRPSLESELKQQQAQRKYAEVAESFTNAVYEQSDSLQPVAEKFKLKIQTAAQVSRSPGPGVAGALANEKLLNALFSADSLENKRNTEAVEVAPNQLVAARITAYTPARTLALQEVHARVRSLYVAEKSAELARKEGEAKLAAWSANPSIATGWAPGVVVGRDALQNLPRPLIDAVLRAPAVTLPAWTGIDLGAQGYAVVKINRLVPRETGDAKALQQQRQQYAQWLSSAEGLAYYEILKDRFKVQIKAPRPPSTGASGPGT